MPETVRELRDLDVDEVSLVGDPAIGEKFLVIKRTGGKQMAEQVEVQDKDLQQETPGDVADDKKPAPEPVKEETQKQDKAALLAAVKQIGSLVGKLLKLLGEKGYGYGSPAMKKSQESDQAIEAAGALDHEAIMSQLGFIAQQLEEGEIPGAEDVEKAGKRFTSGRMKILQEAQALIGKLIADLDKSKTNEEEAEEETGEKKKETKKEEPKPDGEPEPEPETKSDGEETKPEEVSDEAKDEVAKALTEIKDRLATVEAAAGIQRGVSEGGGKEQTEKSGGMWGSVFSGTPFQK